MGDSERLLDVLLAGGRRADRLTHVERIPARTGEQVDWPAWADTSLVAGYRALGVERPWRHQVEAADAAWAGRHTVLATSTGSGKSLAFWLPALSAVRADIGAGLLDPGRIESVQRRGSVLYLCPTKALAADQLTALDRLLTAAHSRDVRVATCDGDTAMAERRWVQDYADVVLTNPDFLHFSLLPGHRRWARLLASLQYVVVDECHAFRGVFGAHVAAVLRRLRRLAAHYGTGPGPTFVLASATTSDPAASASRLLGVDAADVVAITHDTSPAGRKTFALWQPPELPGTQAPWSRAPLAVDPWATGASDEAVVDVDIDVVDGERPRRSATAEIAELLADLTVAGARSLAFTRSRRAAESVAIVTQRHLAAVDPSLAGQVAAYRGGYLPEERRALESSIRTGRLRALATTNALELGVDISGLDVVLIAGWPGTRVSLWQQAGRAGRAGADGLVALVAREDPLDTFLVHHPEAIFAAPVEATVFDPANPYVLAPHLCAAAAELPLRAEELGLFGPDTRELLDVLVERGALRRRASGWYWTRHDSAARLTSLRGTGGDPVRVVEEETGRMLGTVDFAAADATVHPGAVYTHQGITFVVTELHLDDAVALVARRDVDFGTWARWQTSIDIRSTRDERDWGPVTWGFGQVDVATQVLSFQRKRIPDLLVLGSQELDLPVQTLTTAAVWWTVPAAVLAEAGITAELAPGALHAAEHASIGLLPLLATCDRWDLGGVSTEMHVDTERATVFVYDGYPGGAGFAERGFHLGATWLRATREAIAGCRCATGCPACIQSPKCGNANNPLEKAAAIRLLDAVLAYAPEPGEAGLSASTAETPS
ncbi:DEAD/DEAH box helicase [Pengzhenrongella sicca]|uniref:DEAD/DEAH box helicase n=1 Tax=Pengzhenrongella sicca TaxID=2819238 RepID=UPI001D0C614E|nr:DEAD/DEAH box helicase [Pengzhenrongella sicca]